MVKNIFRLSILTIFIMACMVIATPVFTVNKLLYPIRIDSAFVQQQELIYKKQLEKGKADSGLVFIYSPEQLQINYQNVFFTMSDGVVLKGFISTDTTRKNAPMLLIIPGVDEGAVFYIPAMREFKARGLNVCVIDLRGQGISGGEHYEPGNRSVSDLNAIVNELHKYPEVEHIALLGSGTGAGIIIKTTFDSSDVAEVLILQNPPKSLADVFDEQAQSEWGNLVLPFMNTLKHEYEIKTGLQLDEYNYEKMIGDIYVPHMMVAANYFTQKQISETVDMYKTSNYYRKRLLIDKSTFRKVPGLNNSKNYYDNISAFINSSVPKKTQKSKFRKLAEL